jgi:hypothetical protein
MSTSIQSLKSYSDPPPIQSQSGDVFSQIGSHKEVSQFVASPNVEMLWNIIVQNAAFQMAASATDTRSKLRQHYITHLKQYVEMSVRANTKTSLIELNKGFIAEFIRGFKETPAPVQRLDLSNTASVGNGMITIEEIKADRLSNFDNQYDKMKTDFDQYRVTEAVSDTKFTDNTVVEPLKSQDMDDMLSRTVQSRTEQENASVPRNMNETQRARDWLNLNNTKVNTSEMVQPHPEKKSVSFSTESPVPPIAQVFQPQSQPQQVVPSETPIKESISQVPAVAPVSPLIVLQTRMTSMEQKLEEMHAMISKLVPTVSNVVDVEEVPNSDQSDA